jgi:hypothetical protein
MRRILATLLFGIGILAAPLIAQAAPCSPSMTFTTGQTLTAAVLNSNPTTFSGCFSNIDYTNIGAAGIFASQMMPTNSSQATFGGGQNYTFTNNLTVGGTLTAAVLGGLYPSAIAPTTTGQGTFGGSVPITFPNGVTSQAAIQQKVGSTTYTIPYDANSTSGSTNTHIEHGVLVTQAYSGGYACSVSTNFLKSFTTTPTLIVSAASGASGYPYPGSVSASAFSVCSFSSGASGGTATLNWLAVGE